MSAVDIITVVSLILNAAQAMWNAYLQAKFRHYPTHPNDVIIMRDGTVTSSREEQGGPEAP